MGGMRVSKLLASMAAGALLWSAVLAAAPAAPAVEPIDLAAPYRAADYAFVNRAVGAAPVVALGESIHVTREMPLVRLNVLRSLHETQPFGMLAIEGALIDAWTAQEHAYASKAPLAERSRAFTREALFGLWQTDEMERVIAYALSTQSGPRPLYIASFDIQPGSARAYGGSSRKSMEAFLAALRAADPQLSAQQAASWAEAIGPAIGCHRPLADEAALAALEQWIADRGPAAFSGRPPVHVATLKLVPQMIRARLAQCEEAKAKGVPGAYQRSRDVHNARLAAALMGAAPRMFLWAHHSHLHYNSLGKTVPSMGQHLKAMLGDRMYTIGVFAARGTALDSLRADSAEGLAALAAMASRPLPFDERFGVERRLTALSGGDLFVDLRTAPADWAKPDSSRAEVDGHWPTALSRDYDGAILLQRVHGAELNFLPPPFRALLRLVGWVLSHPFLAAAAALAALACLIWGIRALWRRRRRRKAARRRCLNLAAPRQWSF